MFWALPMLAGAALGAGKHFAFDKPAEERSRKLRAEEIRNSTWSGRGPSTQIQYANPWGGIAQGASQGLQLGQSINAAGQSQKLGELGVKNFELQNQLMESKLPKPNFGGGWAQQLASFGKPFRFDQTPI